MSVGRGATLDFEIGLTESGLRLDVLLESKLEDVTRSQIKRWISEGLVACNGKIETKAGTKLSAGDHILFEVPLPAETKLEADPNVPFELVFEDGHIAVVNKPAGVVVHPGAGGETGTLVHGLLARYGNGFTVGSAARPGIVHRLDKDTSGLLVIARTDASYQALVQAFTERTVSREYLALTARVPKAEQRISLPIGRHPADRKKMAVVKAGGKPAITNWVEIARYSYGALLLLSLETGRTHQIRVHLAETHAPILGDKVYGEREGQLPSRVRGAVQALGRQALHAKVLSFSHPITAETMQFESELPEDMQRLQASLEQL